jgi:glycosyltransferase involved in cell wall biosynthesis
VLAPAVLNPASVVFTHNVEAEIFERHHALASNVAMRSLWKSQAEKMRRFEGEALRRFRLAIAVSERDAKQLRERYGLSRVETIATGVDLDYFTFAEPVIKPGNEVRIVFTGSMDWQPNVDGMNFFLRDIWPKIAEALPQATFTIVGRNPPADLVRRAQGLKWTFTGFVDDIRSYVRDADIYVVPLRIGGGTRIKVYEAMASGCPVISTTLGVEGLPIEPDRHYLKSDSANDFAASVLRLGRDSALRRKLASEARRHVEQNFGARTVARRFEEICLSALTTSH